MGLDDTTRFDGLYYDDPGAEAAKVHSTQDLALPPLYIDFQEMNITANMLAAHIRQSTNLHFMGYDIASAGSSFFGCFAVKCCVATDAQVEEHSRARVVARSHAQVDVAPSSFTQFLKCLGLRLDVDAGPTTVVERLGDRIEDWI